MEEKDYWKKSQEKNPYKISGVFNVCFDVEFWRWLFPDGCI